MPPHVSPTGGLNPEGAHRKHPLALKLQDIEQEGRSPEDTLSHASCRTPKLHGTRGSLAKGPLRHGPRRTASGQAGSRTAS